MTTFASMERTGEGWVVIDRDRGVLAREYKFAGSAVANTFVARMGDGKLAVISPGLHMTDEAFAELAAFGEVGALIANNGFHHLGQAAWRQRFPRARCFAPETAIARIQKKSKLPLAFEPLSAFEPGRDLGFREIPNTKIGESWFWAKADGGSAWYASDVLANMPRLPQKPISQRVIGQLIKWSGSGPGYRVFRLGLKFIVRDPAATLRLLQEDLVLHPMETMVPAHGDILQAADLSQRTDQLVADGLRSFQ